jgi:MFS family permease
MAVVAFGAFVAADDLMVVATMLRPMIDDVGLIIPDDLDEAAWIVNVYLIAYLAVMPVAGRLSDAFGRRAVFVAALTVFAAGSLVVPAAHSLPVLLVGRALTALGGGALVPVAMAVAGDLYQGRDRARALGLLGAIETIGWVWGPLYGALLVRFLTWRWQFHLNIPLAIGGIVVGWRVLDPTRRALRTDESGQAGVGWLDVAIATAGLVALNVALLGEAGIQTVTGLEELTGDGGRRLGGRWLYLVAAAAFVLFAWRRRRLLTDRGRSGSGGTGLTARPAVAALGVNGLVGVGLVVALINVPLFVNIVEGDLERAAVRSGWLLTALTATMAVTSYVGGVASGRLGYRVATVAGLVVGAVGLGVMGSVWAPETTPATMAAQLALVGAGIGLVLAPTSTAVVDAAFEQERGTGAGLVVMARLVGFSVGLAGLTAWGLRRYDELRAQVELPPLNDPGYADAVKDAVLEVSTTALAETFVGGAVALAVAVGLAMALGRGGVGQRPSAWAGISGAGETPPTPTGRTDRGGALKPRPEAR